MSSNIKLINNYTIHAIPNVEFVNPIQFDFDIRLDIEISLVNTIVKNTKTLSGTSDNIKHQIAVKRHLKSWNEHYNEVMSVKFPENFFTFLKCKNKKKQESVLAKEEFSFLKMQAIFYRAWEKYDFTFSSYRFEKKPEVFNSVKFPELYHLQPDNTFDIIGQTDLSEGQLRTALEQRNVVLAKFLDNGDIWHCFLHTYDGILGKEVKGMPHIHYISSAFGSHVTRERVLNEIQKFRYRLPPMKHLKYNKKEIYNFPVVPPLNKL